MGGGNQAVSNGTISFEAKKHAFRQTQDGVVISFVLHPNDISPELAAAPLGTQYVVAVAPYVEAGPDKAAQPLPAGSPPPRGQDAKARYAAMSEGEKAVARAAMLSEDREFIDWISVMKRWHPDDGTAAEYIRAVCDIESRREIATNPGALRRFLALELAFQQATGRAAKEPRT